MKTQTRRIAISLGGGFVPGLSSVITGAVLAAKELGWEVVGIRDGFDGLLQPDRYPSGGVMKLTPEIVGSLNGNTSALLGTAARTDPFHARSVNADNQIEEIDRSDELLEKIRAENIEAVISVAGSRGLGALYRLSRKGLNIVCVPESVENDVASTMLSFGFNSALSYAVATLDRARQAAQSARRIGVIEVLGEHAGWLALQAGVAVCADAVLIPEIPYDIHKVAAKLREKLAAGAMGGLVVVAEGAMPIASQQPHANPQNPMKASLAPLATEPEGPNVIARSGRAAAQVALELQRLTDQETYPIVLGQLVKGGEPTAVDRQLGLGYGAGAVRALNEKQSSVMVTFQAPDLKFVPLAETINRVRTVPANSEFVKIGRSLGISLGD